MKEIANCEYVVYLENGKRLDSTEESLVYHLLNSLAYPMRDNPLNAKIISRLSPYEKSLLYSNEAELLRHKIKEINPKFGIVHFPKSLQQFYLFAASENIILSAAHETLVATINKIVSQLVEKQKVEVSQFYEELCKLLGSPPGTSIEAQMENFYPYRTIGYNPGHDDTKLYNDCIMANSSPLTQEVWSAVNFALTRELKITPDFTANAKTLKSFADIWIRKYQAHCSLRNNNVGFGQFDFVYIPENIRLLKAVLYFEIECMFNDATKNMYIIYRGSRMGPSGDQRLISQEPNHRLSFSNGICEGVVNDRGACAWQYFQRTHTSSQQPDTGYALLFDRNKDSNSIKVPPLNSVARLFGYGEDFHVRTKPSKNERLADLLQKQTLIISDMRAIRMQIDNPIYATQYMLANYRLFNKSYNVKLVSDTSYLEPTSNQHQLALYRPLGM